MTKTDNIPTERLCDLCNKYYFGEIKDHECAVRRGGPKTKPKKLPKRP